MAFVLFSAMRNEGPFLLDWIAYHRAIGFDKICIVTNDCTDGSYELLNKLAAEGIVDHFDQSLPVEIGPQRAAVQLLDNVGYLKTGDWAIFLDSDEYLNIHLGTGNVSDLVGYLEENEVIGMLINWRLFGDSGQTHFQGTYVSENYTKCEGPSTFTQFKTLFKAGQVAIGFSGELHRCCLEPEAGTLRDFLTGSGIQLGSAEPGKPKRRHVRWLANGEEPFSHLMGAEIGYAIAQINHYIVRDPSSFALKKQRGRGHVAGGGDNLRHTDKFYRAQNRNEETDQTILRWADAVEAEKANICATCAVEEELNAIQQLYVAHVNADHPVLAPTTGLDPRVSRQFPLTFPDEVSAFMREAYGEARAIIEYGSGGSTVLAAEMGVPCLSVESDADWAAALNAELEERFSGDQSAQAVHVDIGPTKKWGYPTNRTGAARYWRYPLEIWDTGLSETIDTVLIDGRMRKACFVATLLNIKCETRVLFDDYGDRRKYHHVERFAQPKRMIGRMAEFVVSPGIVTTEDFRQLIPWFSEMH